MAGFEPGFMLLLLIAVTILSTAVIVLYRRNRQLKASSAQAALLTQSLMASENRFRTIFERVDALAIQGYQPDGTVIY